MAIIDPIFMRPLPNWLKKIAWLIGIWMASVILLAAAAYGIKLILIT